MNLPPLYSHEAPWLYTHEAPWGVSCVSPGRLGLSSSLHTQASHELAQAFANMGIAPTAEEFEAVLAVGCHEGSYGRGWVPGSPMDGSHNWGAIQCCQVNADGSCPPGSALQGDTHADGTKYTICFKTYPSHVDGAAALVKFLYRAGVPEALRSGDLLRVADRMFYGLRYFEGVCRATDAPDPAGKAPCAPADRIRRYAETLDKCAAEIAKSLGTKRATRVGSPTSPLLIGALIFGAAYATVRFGPGLIAQLR